MKHKSVHQKLEELVQNHLNIPSLNKAQHHDRHDVSVQQIEKILRAAFLMGERAGYKHGFNDAKQACDCETQNPMADMPEVPLTVDIQKQLV